VFFTQSIRDFFQASQPAGRRFSTNINFKSSLVHGGADERAGGFLVHDKDFASKVSIIHTRL